jgi:cellulose synthase/poly-beta-1,6-N-acetylglucosamine synthase-like glycosyltransferase
LRARAAISEASDIAVTVLAREALLAVALLYALAQVLLLVYASHRWLLLWRWWRVRRPRRAAHAPATAAERALDPHEVPHVTVQLPVYDEPEVVERLIEAVARLDWPGERLEIQVLDDSTDDTPARAAAAIARRRRAGVRITHLRRARRDGFKAGALAAGLAQARGELVAVFDADFVPTRDFLRRAVTAFADPRVGVVQARWGHLNRHRSWITAAQATMLDAHFTLEHATRAAGGLFLNFNGTAGVWRRSCIAAAGGWSHDTLTEDLDLSYRAQLLGWRVAYVNQLVAPAELPAAMSALMTQQHRWAKGSIQTARKLLPRILAARLPARVKLEAFVHLTGNVAYPLVLVLALLLLPVLLMPATLPGFLVLALQAMVVLLGMVPVAAFLAIGRREAGAGWRRAIADVPGALLLGIGLTLNNSRAVWEGLRGRGGRFERTPKTGDEGAGPRPMAARTGERGRGELGLAIYFLTVALFAAPARLHAEPFLAVLVAGFAAVGIAARRERSGRAVRGA